MAKTLGKKTGIIIYGVVLFLCLEGGGTGCSRRWTGVNEKPPVRIHLDLQGEDTEVIEEVARRMAIELEGAGMVRVTGPKENESRAVDSADFRLSGRLGHSTRGETDILSAELVASGADTVVFRKIYVREPFQGDSAFGEKVPLANGAATVRGIAAFLGRNKTPLLSIVTREEWGARPPKETLAEMRYEGGPDRFLNWIVVHHTAYDASGPRAVQDEHMLPQGNGPGKHPFGRNWDDVGYHFLVDQEGRVYAGRELEYMGAHVGGGDKSDRRLHANFGAIGIALLGDFREREPSLGQVTALEELLAYLRYRYTILPDHVLGHREMGPVLLQRGLPGPKEGTICPGDRLFDVVEGWREGRLDKKGKKSE